MPCLDATKSNHKLPKHLGNSPKPRGRSPSKKGRAEERGISAASSDSNTAMRSHAQRSKNGASRRHCLEGLEEKRDSRSEKEGQTGRQIESCAVEREWRKGKRIARGSMRGPDIARSIEFVI